MSFAASKNKRPVFLLPALLILFALPVHGQPAGAAAKIADADKAYNKAYQLIENGTAESFAEAFRNFQTAERLYGETGQKFGLGKSYVGLGFTSDALGRKPEAIRFYEQALPIFSELGNKYWEARTLNNLGRIYDELGENEKALEYLLRALPLRKEARDPNGEAVTLNAIGLAYSGLGQNEKALDFYNRALNVRDSEAIDDDRHNTGGKASILNNIGLIYDELGNEEKALDFYNRSLPLRRQTGDRTGEATTLNNIGLIYYDLGEERKALEFYERALTILKETGNRQREAATLNNIGTVRAKLGENEQALENFARALELYRRSKNLNGEAKTLNNIGLVRTGLDENERAFENFNQALIILQSVGDKSVEAITLHNLMLLAQKDKNKPLAVFYGKQAVNKYQELRQSIRNLDIETRKKYLKTIERTYRTLADLLIESGRFAQAEQVLQMLKEEEYFDFVKRDEDEIKTLDQGVSLTEKEKAVIARYRALADEVSQAEQAYAELERKKDQLAEEDKAQFTELDKRLNDANAAFRLFLEKELVKEFGASAFAGVEYDRGLQTKLKQWGEGTVALYTVVTEDRYRVILTTPYLQIDGKTEISAADLNQKIYAYRAALQDLAADPRPLGKELYDILLKPVEKHLQAANAETLVWSLDGALRYIPVSTLSPDGKTYLIEKYRSVVTTPRTREDLSDSDTEWEALGLGVSEPQTVKNPDDPDQMLEFAPIPGTKEELLKIVRDENSPAEKGILKGRRFLDKEFTIGSLTESLSVRDASGRRKYTAVHIASHFQLGSNWSNSFLLLGNGQILTLRDLKNSPAMDFGGVELVTLSACNTAYTADSNGREIDSLAAVIQAKSGKAVLAALWAVADESTPLLMSGFYRRRKDNPHMTKAEAMQKVQTGFLSGELKPSAEFIDKLDNYLRSKPGATYKFDRNAPFAHPYFWSPFVLIGNWR